MPTSGMCKSATVASRAAGGAARSDGIANRAARRGGGAARRCVSAAKGVHVRGHAGAWRARAGTRRSGLRLVRGDARPRGRRAGTRTPGGFSSRGRGPANIGQSKAHGAVWPLGRRVGAEFARPSLRGRDGTSLLSARLPRGLCGGECAAEAKSRYFRNRNGLMPA